MRGVVKTTKSNQVLSLNSAPCEAEVYLDLHSLDEINSLCLFVWIKKAVLENAQPWYVAIEQCIIR